MTTRAKNAFVSVVVELPVEGEFTYSVPESLGSDALVGRRALVPFGNRTVTGYIVATSDGPGDAPVKSIKPLKDILDEAAIFDARRLKFFRWLSTYYFAPLGEVLSLIHPAGANIKSVRTVSITPDGLLALEVATASKKAGFGGEADDDLEVLRRACGGAKGGVKMTTLVRALKGSPVNSIVKRLARKGLVTEEFPLSGGRGVKTEKVVTLVKGVDAGEIIKGSTLKRAPLQGEVFSYLADSGETTLAKLREALPGAGQAVKALEKKGFVEVSEREAEADCPFSDIEPRAASHKPNAEQRKAIDSVKAAMEGGGFSPFLLYGVTGSGKTLVYLRAIEEAVRMGKRAVVLVPEIALTTRAAAYLTEHFPGRVALVHSALSEGERMAQWRRVTKGEVDVVVGTRSALFSPIPKLGLIIVDEEHDPSYKQEEGVRYHARDSAVMLAKSLGVTVLLGSATPSIESFYNAREGRFTLLELTKRVEERPMPSVELMDMRGNKHEVLSERLVSLLKECVEAGDQALLFLNRRGYSNFLICTDCGHSFECTNCSVTLTYHRGAKRLKCHYCDLAIPIPEKCPSCEGNYFSNPGMGTEKVEEELRHLLPSARIGRMDRDTTRRKGVAKEILDAMDAREVDILVGTQMVGKGHDFPGITLVGVISGDTSLMIPDFRGAERTFQLISQAAGRAGRGEKAGQVVVQTLNPEHFCFRDAAKHDFINFYDDEVEDREALFYPPFSRLSVVRLDGLSGAGVERAAVELKTIANVIQKGKTFRSIKILGPAPSFLSKLKGRHRWQLLIKAGDAKELNRFVWAIKNSWDLKKGRKVRMTVDMDPLTTV